MRFSVTTGCSQRFRFVLFPGALRRESTILAGFVAEGLTGAWWVDAVTSLGIVWLLVKEGCEARSGGRCCA